jgi:hypothetical protein
MSQDEDDESGSAKAFFFSSAAPVVATTVMVAPSPAKTETSSGAEAVSGFFAEPSTLQFERITEAVPAPQPRDYAADFPSSPRNAVDRNASDQEERDTPPVTSLFSQGHLETERDLDVPAFLRRSQF